jgi:hypothetical protein
MVADQSDRDVPIPGRSWGIPDRRLAGMPAVSKRLGCLLRAGEIPPHRQPVVQVLDVIGLTL